MPKFNSRIYTKKDKLFSGPAFKDKNLSNNDTDFLTFTPIKNIDYNDFFSFKDSDNFIYAFSIKSLNYIINTSKENPYNRKKISLETQLKFKKLLELKKINLNIDFKLPSDRKSKIKQHCLKIFQRMDDLKLYTQPRWFLDLNLNKLKKLYIETEDIWNYRTMLTIEQKKKYTKSGKAFLTPISKINSITNICQIQEILLSEYDKFAFEGKTPDDCITSCYWILMGLSIVSNDAAEGMPELVHSQVIN